METKERFESKYFVAPDGCWLWTSGVSTKGYGQFHIRAGKGSYKNVLAHRFSYELAQGPIPEGLELDHLCRQRSCVNPYHLEAVTQKENLSRGEGACAKNARKTFCVNGHKFDESNTLYNKKGRACRTCVNKNTREYRRKKKLASTLELLTS
jgi:hypothetical protein